MPVTETETPYRVASVGPPGKHWTRAECEALQTTGLWDLRHIELVEGKLINKRMGKNRTHSVARAAMRAWRTTLFGGRNEPVAPLAAPQSEFRVGDAFPE